MALRIRDHGAFQRAGLVLLGLGGALGALGGLVAIDRPQVLLAAVVGTAALASVLAEARLRGTAVARAVVPALGALAGLALAWATWQALAGGVGGLGDGGVAVAGEGGLLPLPWDEGGWRRWSLVEGTAAGALFGLVAALGLVPGHLVRSRRDPVAEGLASARARFRADPGAGEAWTLVQRAAAAHERTRAGLAEERSASAAELREGAGALTLQVIELAGRCRELGLELATVDVVEVEARSVALAEAAGATADEAARRDFGQAARTSAELQERLAALRAAHDRLRARLSLQVTILESTALALSTRRASSLAEAALTPLADRVREAGLDLEAEARALAE
jgi:hypothetical protein